MIVPDGTVLRGWSNLFECHTARLNGPVTGWTTRITMTALRGLRDRQALCGVREDDNSAGAA